MVLPIEDRLRKKGWSEEEIKHAVGVMYGGEKKEKHGEFKTIADLTRVKGIGNKLLEKNEGLLLIDEPGK